MSAKIYLDFSVFKGVWIQVNLTLSSLLFSPIVNFYNAIFINNKIVHALRPTIKNCWFAVLLPTHPKQALPKKIYCLSEDFFFL